jgi:hypothetical protein
VLHGTQQRLGCFCPRFRTHVAGAVHDDSSCTNISPMRHLSQRRHSSGARRGSLAIGGLQGGFESGRVAAAGDPATDIE